MSSETLPGPRHGSINYLEFPSRDPALTKAFFGQVFGWTFVDYGPDYCAFKEPHTSSVEGGFYRADASSDADAGAVLIVFYSQDLAATQQAVEQAGGTVSRAVFEFPGGRRFHFKEPCGNEFAVWSDQ
ncbi:VOC family protein [Aliamphritea hakodatensis]|uniref:VOC family protein n=1 Tax=Aliamphritea hakodatensis TaxID=2895352 RepID=UPI0022FD3F7A|nr:VOC family protein [Aliamphritea hakodatensis]